MKVNSVFRGAACFLLTLCLVLSMVPVQALASGTCTCTDKCSFSAPNASCAHCSTAEESAFHCGGTLPSGVSAGSLTRTYGSGLEETFSLSVTGGSGQLTIGYNKSYSVSVSGNSVSLRWSDVLPGELNAGTYSLSYTFRPSSADYRESSGTLSFQVLPKPVSASLELSQTSYVYDGSPKTPVVTATGDGRTLTQGTDYTLLYQNNTAPGTATVKLQDVPGDNYSVSGQASFTITRASANIGAVSYTGGTLLDSMSPRDVVLTRQDTTVPGNLAITETSLTAGTNTYHWTFTPSDSGYETAGGTVTLTVDHDWTEGSCTEAPSCRGCGEVSGTAPGHSLSYSVSGPVITEKCSTPGFEHTGTLKLELASGTSTEYTGSPVKPLKITYSDSWVGPRDHSVSYENNTDIGTATGSVTVGNVTAKLTFEITPISMNVTARDVTVAYDAQPHTGSVTAPQDATVRYGTKSGSYTLTQCPSYTDAGEYTVYYQVTKANHKTVEGSFRIVIQPLNLTVRAEDAQKTYGESDPAQFTWKITSGKLLGSQTLTGITVSRASGEDAGTYSITPSQTGSANKNYKITFESGTFTIQPREITIQWGELELTYNGTEQAPKATAGNTVYGDQLELTVSGGRTDATKGQKVTARVTGITGTKAGNYTLPKEVSAQFEIKKATMEEPKLRYTDETVEGKHDGAILDVTKDMEYRREDETSYTAITGTKVENLAPGVYYIRYAESDNCYVSRDAMVVIGQGDKLKITLPKDQTGYVLTVDHKEVAYGGETVLRFSLQEGCEKTEDFALKVNGVSKALRPDGTLELKDIREDLVITVEGVSDGEPPAAQIRIGGRSWDSLLAGIKYNLYYGQAQTVTITAEDEGTGVDKIHYHLAFYELTLDQLKAVYNWKEYTAPFTIRPDNKYVIYVRVTDKTGNVNYICSEGIILDELPPDIDGVKARGVYYTTQKVTASDNFKLTSFKLDGSTFDGMISGNPSVETRHTLAAWDAAGNTVTMTITMMPISTLGEGLPQEDQMTLEDMEAIREVLETVQTILEKQCKYATAREKQELEALEQKCLELLAALEAPAQVAELLEALPDPLIAQPDDKTAIDALETAQEAYDALSDREKEMLGSRAVALDALRKALTDYKIIQGDNEKWSVGNSIGLAFTANGYYDKFRGVELDGETLDPEYYSSRSGSTVVTLKAEFLETLESGKHTIRIVYTDGETNEATFRISQPIRLTESGGSSNLIGILFWGALGLACLVAIVLIILLILWRKDKE